MLSTCSMTYSSPAVPALPGSTAMRVTTASASVVPLPSKSSPRGSFTSTTRRMFGTYSHHRTQYCLKFNVFPKRYEDSNT
jgi:hypothetical protein